MMSSLCRAGREKKQPLMEATSPSSDTDLLGWRPQWEDINCFPSPACSYEAVHFTPNRFVFLQGTAKVRFSKSLSKGEKAATASRKEKIKESLAELKIPHDPVVFLYVCLREARNKRASLV